MDKKIFILLFFLIIINSFIILINSADYSDLNSVSANLGTFKQNDCVIIKTILNVSYVNISSLSYPNSSIALTNEPMTKTGYTFNYSFCNTSDIGIYLYDYNDDLGNVYVNYFNITPTGTELTIAQGIIYFFILIFFILLFLLCLFGAIMIPVKNKKGNDGKVIGINKLKYIKFILWFVSYLMMLLIFGVLYDISISFFYAIEGIKNFTESIFFMMLYSIIPIFLVTIAFIIINWVVDNKTQESLRRNLPLR